MVIIGKSFQGISGRKPYPDKASAIPFEMIDLGLVESLDLEGELHRIRRKYIEQALAACKGNKTRAAKLLGYRSYQTMDKHRRD